MYFLLLFIVMLCLLVYWRVSQHGNIISSCLVGVQNLMQLCSGNIWETIHVNFERHLLFSDFHWPVEMIERNFFLGAGFKSSELMICQWTEAVFSSNVLQIPSMDGLLTYKKTYYENIWLPSHLS